MSAADNRHDAPAFSSPSGRDCSSSKDLTNKQESIPAATQVPEAHNTTAETVCSVAQTSTVSSEDTSLVVDPLFAQLHRVLLMMLHDFATICDQENLRWYASYGTAIGALRHKGFIPWDDDVDICMPRADLDRLTAEVQQHHSGRYRMIDATLDARYPMATTRMMLVGTEFRDTALATMDFESGVFLDLFPLDNLADDERDFRRQAWRAWLYNKLAIAKCTKNPFVAGSGARAAILRSGARVMHTLLNLPGVSSINFNRLSIAEQKRYEGQHDTRRVGFLCDTGRFWDIYDRVDLEPARVVPFESTTIRLAYRAEKLLSTLYGDYLIPPPVDERIQHYHEILDFGPYAHL